MWALFSSCVAGAPTTGTPIATIGGVMNDAMNFDAEDFDFQNALPTGNKFIMNTSSLLPTLIQGAQINLLSVSTDGNTVTFLHMVTATAA
jgi:hypothetical protein